MKFVHIADMHFDTSFTQLNNSHLGTLRRLEQRKILKKVIDYIKNNNVKYLFIAGDLYEHKYIRESTIEYINNLFKEINDTEIFITPGNHDPYLKNSFYSKYDWNENVHIFGPNISKIEYEDVNIYGYGFNDFYYTNAEIEKFEIEDKNKINILITHGTLNGTNNIERQYNAISKSILEKIGFDYVALGHIHKSNYNEEKNIIYPGSTISMGFDELGAHGMIVGDINKNELDLQFIPLDESEFKIINVDITEMIAIDELIENINNLQIDENDYYEIYIVGKRKFEIDKYALKKMITNQRIIKLKNLTKRDYDIQKIVDENTLKGLFVKEILDRMENNDSDKELLENALEIGLEILDK
ncbi:MAG: DNA repair exonuclease [Clostridia bacterium]|nr:DNA repair exonuclease [Clostridia bacterium]